MYIGQIPCADAQGFMLTARFTGFMLTTRFTGFVLTARLTIRFTGFFSR
ncbi:MAG TPA: hypothetical protein PKE69_21735 [Pyrinomonadaceae bacterium]|nr:hypothetical protein [Pyrinomonadaceae bacterium]